MPHILDLKAADHPVKAVTIFNTTKVVKGLFGSSQPQTGTGAGLFGNSRPQTGKAEIVRGFTVQLAEGENRVHITGLSSHIEFDSARISGLADDVRVFDVVCSIKKVYVPAENDPEEVIRLLQQRKGMLESMKSVRTQEASILVQYGMSLKGEHMAVEKAQSFLETFVANGQENIQAVNVISEEIIAVEREIAKLQDQMQERKGSAEGSVMAVLYASQACGAEIRLTYMVSGASWCPVYDLHATSDEESGRPLPSVGLHFRAGVTQITGEDWGDASLALSTASFDSFSQTLPDFKSLRIAPAQTKTLFGAKGGSNAFGGAPGKPTAFGISNQQPPGFGGPFMQQQQASAFGGQSAFGSNNNAGGALFGSSAPLAQQPAGEVIPPPPAAPATSLFGASAVAPTVPTLFGTNLAPQPSGEEDVASSEFVDLITDTGLDSITNESAPSKSRTIVTESPFATTYKVDGSASIPSDGRAHQVLVAVLPFEASISWIAVPRARAVVYLQCEVKNTSEFRLLPGPVNVFMDNSSVSRTSIGDITIGDTFKCTLGADPAVRITFARTRQPTKLEGGQYADQTRISPFTILITVRNAHRFAIPSVVIKDGMPVAGDDKRIRVIVRKPAGLADAKEEEAMDVQDQNGLKVKWPKEGKKGGLVEWEATLDAGADVKLESEYEVRGPADAQWAFKLD